MITILAKDLKNYGIQPFADMITFRGKVFVPSQTFAYRFYQQAIALAEEKWQQGCLCLLIDYGTYITLWQGVNQDSPQSTSSLFHPPSTPLSSSSTICPQSTTHFQEEPCVSDVTALSSSQPSIHALAQLTYLADQLYTAQMQSNLAAPHSLSQQQEIIGCEIGHDSSIDVCHPETILPDQHSPNQLELFFDNDQGLVMTDPKQTVRPVLQAEVKTSVTKYPMRYRGRSIQ